MRAKLLLLAVAFAASHASKNDKIIDQVFSSWLDGPVNYGDHWRSRREAADQTQQQTEFDRNNQFQFETAEEHHGRSKRAANPFLNAAANVLTPNRFCNQPGYTGEFCQYPICTEANPRVVDHEAISGDGTDIDAAFLGNSCNGTYVTVFDDLIYNIKITITAGGNINPSWDLVDSNGKHWFFDELISRSPSVLSGIYSTLPPGTYYITATPDVNNAACNVKIKARTRVVIEGGFITGETWATERNDFPDLKYTYQYTLNTFVAHPSNLRSPGRMAVVSIIEGNNIMSRPQELKIRYGCSYEYYYESFFCTNLNYYLWIVEGITWGGYPFRRLGSFQCLYNTNRPTPAPTGTTPAPTSPTSCANRGLLVTNPDNSTFCICNGLWQGATCSQLVCMNGGNDVGGSDCECPSGFQGRHCQDVVCADRGNTNFNIDKPTMVFAVRVRKQLQDVIDQVRQAIVDIVNLISVYDPEYVTRFGLVFYLDGRIEHVRGYGSLTETLNAWDRYAKNINDTKGNCTDYEFGALASALQAIEVSPRSKIYLITDSMPQDYTDDLETVFQLDSYFRVPIYPIYVEPAPGTLCYPDLHNPGYRALDDIAQRTEGLTFYVTNRTDVKNLLYNHLYATFYRTQLLLNDDLEVCSMQSTYKSISVDTTLDELVIVARGKGLTPYISGEATIQLTTKYAGNDIYIWSANGVVAGNYFINFLSSQALSSCAYRIFQRAYHTATFNNPQFELFWKFTESMNSEGYFQQPVVGFGASIAMHLTNFPTRIPAQYVQAELLIYATREGKQTPIYFSNGIWRDGCDYNFYFPPFTCRTAREILHFQFFTKDALGFPIQRSGSIYCSEYHPTFAPPTGCQHGGVPSPADNSTCFCPPGYTGKQCEQLVCFNGGTPLNFGFCQCPPGFVGTHCEYTSCIEKGPRPDIFIHGVDMVFAVETTTTAFGQIVYLNQMFPEILRDMVSQHRDWIRNFILVGYNSTWGGIIARSPAFDQHVVINALNDIATNPNNLDNTPEACNVTVKTWDALGSVLLRFNLRPASFINLFTASKPDQNDVQAIIEMYEMIRGKAIQLSAVIGYNSLGTPGYFCNNTFATFELLHDACRYSNGESYALQHAVVKNFVQTFPMKYMQGVVAHRRYSDCTDARYVSVPVDAYTQTLLVNVEGFQATVELYNGRGELQEYPNFRRIDTDTVTGWNFFALRAPCDPDWDNVGDYCIHYGMAESDYQTAYNVCHNSGGMLADDLSLDKHQYLIDNGAAFSFWFGLNNLNASGWQWDRESGVPSVPYNTSGVNYWNGGVVPNDPSKACAYFDSSKKTNNWNADSCTLKKKYVCQKHKFDYNYEPNRIDDDDLPAGKYYLKVTTQFPTGNAKGGCFIEVRAQSHLQVYSGFSADTHADYPDMDPIAGSPNNHIITFVDSAASFQQRTPILTHALIFSAHNDTMWDAVTFQPRSMCSFEWLSQEFACPDSKNPDNLMSIYHLGEDEYGHTFQRIVNAHCQKQTITCGNGGLRYNGVCVCTEYWQGKMCTVPVCVNGGRLDESNTACVCPIGFAGESCQYETCTNPMNVTFDNSGTSLVFVLEVTQNSKDTLNKLVDGLNTLLPTLPSGWFGNYILVTFNSKGVVYNQPLNTVVGLLGSISSQINGITDAASCSMPIYGAIAAAFQNPQLRPGAQLVLVSASVPSDTANRWSTIEQLTGAAPRIHNFYSSTAACSAGAEIPNSDDALHLQRFAYASDGNNLFVDSTAISSMVAIYLPTLYKSNTIAHPTYFNNFTCGTPENWLLQIDNNSTDVYVTVSSDVGSLSVVDPYNDILSPDPIFNYKSQKIYHFERTHGGIYRFQVSSPGPCYVNVQANNGPQVWNAFVQPSAADPTGAHTDQITLSAIAGTNVAVFHLAGTDERHIGRLWYFTMWDPMQQKAIFGELYPRGKCHFEFYSDPFNCTANEPFYMSVMGVDQMYQPFTRQVAAFCIAGAPPPTGPTTTSTTTTTTTTTTMTTLPRTGPTTTGPLMTTTMGMTTTSYGLRDIQLDILFLIDASASGKNNFDDYATFIKTLMVPFTVSQAKTRVAFTPVFGTDGETFVSSPFSASYGQDAVISGLNLIKTQANDFDTAGQYAGDALDQVAAGTYKQPGSGYRAEITNHLVVYITSNSQFDDAALAQQTAQYIRSHHYFGLIAIGYKGGARDALQTISGGSSCTYLPTDLNGLIKVASTVQTTIFDNDPNVGTNPGIYCN